MFELPEIATLARQINATLSGKVIRQGSLGNSPHKFVWYNQSHVEFTRLTAGKAVGEARGRGKWLLIALEPGYTLLLGECGGKLLYHPPSAPLPQKYHLLLKFEDGSALTAFTQMWGAMELYEAGQEMDRQYIRGMRPTPVEADFSLAYFNGLLDELAAGEKLSAKGLLTQQGYIPGVGNSIAQDILYQAKLHPRRLIQGMDGEQRQRLYRSIVGVVEEAVRLGGRNDEVDLFRQPGGYVRIMDSRAVGKPCPQCGSVIEKIQFLGGACYFCPACQPA